MAKTYGDSKYIPILSVSSKPATEKDVDEIERGRCLHCKSEYDPMKPVIFVRLGGSEIIWWCRQGMCEESVLV